MSGIAPEGDDDEGGGHDRGDGGRVETDSLQGPEVLEHGAWSERGPLDLGRNSPLVRRIPLTPVRVGQDFPDQRGHGPLVTGHRGCTPCKSLNQIGRASCRERV